MRRDSLCRVPLPPHPGSTELTEVRPLSREGRGESTKRISLVLRSQLFPARMIAGRRQADCRGLRRASRNRRKSRALNRRNAHNGPFVVRVGALTNKAAHYRFPLVRRCVHAVGILTSIMVAVTVNICRERRGVPVARRCGVRTLAFAAHIAERHGGRSLHLIVGLAHENARFTHDWRGIVSAVEREAELPHRFVGDDGRTVRKVQAPHRRTNRDFQGRLRICIEQFARQTLGFAAENEHVFALGMRRRYSAAGPSW